MPNPALDQFSNALFWQVVPVIILCGIGGIILRELLQWLERRTTKFGRDAGQRRPLRPATPNYNAPPNVVDSPHCPECNAAMVKRKARRGTNAGTEFWGCPSYPSCRGTREV